MSYILGLILASTSLPVIKINVLLKNYFEK